MRTVIELGPGERLPDATAGHGATPMAAAAVWRHAPDRHLMLLADDRALLARASCWWREAPQLPGERIGVIGHYAAADEASAQSILAAACRALARADCTRAIGPMDGNTWRRYRFIVDRGSEPPFFLEPDNPDEWPGHFAAAGFDVLATYTSAVNEDLSVEDPRLPTAETRLRASGGLIRPLNPGSIRDELRRIFHLSLEAFQKNYLYTPQSVVEFLEQNEQLLPYVDPDLVLMAERAGSLIGFLFAVPDVLQRQRDPALNTLVIKTVAVAPGAAQAGLGSVLVGLAQQRAHARGYHRVIHALMHERNASRNISRRYARTIRRYALYSRPLPPEGVGP